MHRSPKRCTSERHTSCDIPLEAPGNDLEFEFETWIRALSCPQRSKCILSHFPSVSPQMRDNESDDSYKYTFRRFLTLCFEVKSRYRESEMRRGVHTVRCFF